MVFRHQTQIKNGGVIRTKQPTRHLPRIRIVIETPPQSRPHLPSGSEATAAEPASSGKITALSLRPSEKPGACRAKLSAPCRLGAQKKRGHGPRVHFLYSCPHRFRLGDGGVFPSSCRIFTPEPASIPPDCRCTPPLAIVPRYFAARSRGGCGSKPGICGEEQLKPHIRAPNPSPGAATLQCRGIIVTDPSQNTAPRGVHLPVRTPKKGAVSQRILPMSHFGVLSSRAN